MFIYLLKKITKMQQLLPLDNNFQLSFANYYSFFNKDIIDFYK